MPSTGVNRSPYQQPPHQPRPQNQRQHHRNAIPRRYLNPKLRPGVVILHLRPPDRPGRSRRHAPGSPRDATNQASSAPAARSSSTPAAVPLNPHARLRSRQDPDQDPRSCRPSETRCSSHAKPDQAAATGGKDQGQQEETSTWIRTSTGTASTASNYRAHARAPYHRFHMEPLWSLPAIEGQEYPLL